MGSTKHVLILTADTGFGHRSAAESIEAALHEVHGDACAVETINPLNDKRVAALLRDSQTDYDRFVHNMPSLYRLGYQASDAAVPSAMVDGALTVMLFEVMYDLVQHCQPDAIVTTYPLYQAPLGAVYALSRHYVPLLTVVTDLVTVHRLWFHEAADLCLVPTQAARDLGIRDGFPAHKIEVTGIPVRPDLLHEKRDAAAIRTDLGWRPDLTTALAVGSRRAEHLGGVLQVLSHSGLPLQLAVVAGGNDELYHQFQNAEWHVPAYLYNFVANMPTLMHAADCLLCKAGGLIVSEALACGLPLLMVDVLPGQETGNAEYVIGGGAGELAASPTAALEIMHHWLAQDGALLAERAHNAHRLGRPRAAYDVAERAWAAAQRGPRAKTSRHIRGRPRLVELLSRYGVPWQRSRLAAVLAATPLRRIPYGLIRARLSPRRSRGMKWKTANYILLT